jgi:hypothetical protein
MPPQVNLSITRTVRLFTMKDGRIRIVGSKSVRALLASCNFPEKATLLIRASPKGTITLATSVEALGVESAEITPQTRGSTGSSPSQPLESVRFDPANVDEPVKYGVCEVDGCKNRIEEPYTRCAEHLAALEKPLRNCDPCPHCGLCMIVHDGSGFCPAGTEEAGGRR